MSNGHPCPFLPQTLQHQHFNGLHLDLRWCPTGYHLGLRETFYLEYHMVTTLGSCTHRTTTYQLRETVPRGDNTQILHSTTAYHPKVNSMVEQFHNFLKTSFACLIGWHGLDRRSAMGLPLLADYAKRRPTIFTFNNDILTLTTTSRQRPVTQPPDGCLITPHIATSLHTYSAQPPTGIDVCVPSNHPCRCPSYASGPLLSRTLPCECLQQQDIHL